MILKQFHISNFKMFDDLKLNFESGFNLLLGDNGVGKTTILEAIGACINN